MRVPDLKNEALGHQAWIVKRSHQAWDACVANWYVKLQGYHPMLEWFVVMMSHLRPMAGTPLPKKNQDSSTHEIVIAALDPEIYLFEELDPDEESRYKFKLQLPLEIVHQFTNLTDLQSKSVCLSVVMSVLDEEISPDREEFYAWLKKFNDLNRFHGER